MKYSLRPQLLTAVVLLLLSAPLFGQGKYELKLVTQSFTPEANSAEGIDLSKHIFNDRAYTIIQFMEIPTDAERKQMEALGVSFLEYLPNYAYVVSVPESFTALQLDQFGVRSYLPMGIYQKTSNDVADLFRNDAIISSSNDNIELVIKFHKDVDYAAAKETLRNKVQAVVSEYEYSKLVTIITTLGELETLIKESYVSFIQFPDPDPEPEDDYARSLHRSNAIATDYGAGRKYDGTGVVIGIGDDGLVGPHIDYEGRIDQSRLTSSTGSHGDMVAGIFMGAGNLDPTAKGHAFGAFVHMFDVWDVINDAVTAHLAVDMKVTNLSYSNGCNAGYTNFTQTADQQINDYPTMIHVFSAGNSNNNDCGYGAGDQWGNVTGGVKIAKNVIAVANLNSNDVLQNSSSRGPASDGRIKPEISANGAGQNSTDPNNTYSPGGGTSAAAPSLAGVTAQLYHAYRELNGGNDPETPLLKAILLNAADDLGNAGPDFKYGFGRVNARRSVQILEQNQYLTDQVSQGNTNTHSITVPAGTKELRTMVIWLDPPGSTAAAKALVNDLNFQVTDPGNTTYNPWVLDHTPDPALLDLPATRGIDTLNNVEQVTIDDPTAGVYSLSVDGSSVPLGPQKYYIVYEFVQDEITVTYPMGGEGWVPGETVKIRWDAYGTGGTFDVELSINNGQSWTTIISGLAGFINSMDYTVPNTITGEGLIRITRGGISDVNDAPLTIIDEPDNIIIGSACPNSFVVGWDAVNGATSYDVFLLGNMYMDSIGSTNDTSFTVTNVNPLDEYWVSVRARGPLGIKGRRAYAINKTPGTFNCTILDDIALANISIPASGTLQSCLDINGLSVSVNITNEGQNSASNFPIYYQLDNGPVQTETYTGTLASGATASYSFTNTTLNGFSPNNSYSLKAWVDLPADPFTYNDTSTNILNIVPGSTITAPFSENMETFTQCGTSNDCEQEICILANGWINETNGAGDDIDWRTDNDGTNSNNTGPDVDHNPGTTSGFYIYLEASGDCEQKTGSVISPCVDLTNALVPNFSFWYHMDGVDMGELHVDVFSNGMWIEDVVSVVSGDQGDQWIEQTLSLSPYIGQVINIRLRGITGDDFRSDIALDDFNFTETQIAPTVDFAANTTVACMNTITELYDQSVGASSWNWSIFPSNFVYANNTSGTSQNPEVIFTSPGQYNITLTASNQFGSNTITKTAYINVLSVAPLPVIEDFEATATLPSGWTIENPDGQDTWQIANAVGADGLPTQAYQLENFVYNGGGQEDGLLTMPLDLDNVTAPYLTFDWAYVQFNNTTDDKLEVEISIDCGETFLPTSFNNSGPDLATSTMLTTAFVPTAAGDWSNDTIDLSNFQGNTVIIRFLATNDFGNNLYIDNINVNADFFPAAGFAVADEVCEGETVIFTDTSAALNPTSIQWDFGTGAQPATATTSGPHNVVYTSAGTKTVTLNITNGSGSDIATKQIVVDPLPDAAFSFTATSGTVNFNNTSQNGTSYAWHFGDGNLSFNNNAVYTYTSAGNYEVHLIATNDCGNDTSTTTLNVAINGDTVIIRDTIILDVVALDKNSLLVNIFPNPSEGVFNYSLQGLEQGLIRLEVLSLNGQAVVSKEVRVEATEINGQLNLAAYAKGIYLLRITNEDGTATKKIIIQ